VLATYTTKVYANIRISSTFFPKQSKTPIIQSLSVEHNSWCNTPAKTPSQKKKNLVYYVIQRSNQWMSSQWKPTFDTLKPSAVLDIIRNPISFRWKALAASGYAVL